MGHTALLPPCAAVCVTAAQLSLLSPPSAAHPRRLAERLEAQGCAEPEVCVMAGGWRRFRREVRQGWAAPAAAAVEPAPLLARTRTHAVVPPRHAALVPCPHSTPSAVQLEIDDFELVEDFCD